MQRDQDKKAVVDGLKDILSDAVKALEGFVEDSHETNKKIIADLDDDDVNPSVNTAALKKK